MDAASRSIIAQEKEFQLDAPILELVVAAVVAAIVGAAIAYALSLKFDRKRVRALGKQHAQELAKYVAENRKLVEVGSQQQAEIESLEGKIGAVEGMAANYQSELEAILSEQASASARHEKELSEVENEYKRAVESSNAEATRANSDNEMLKTRLDELEQEAENHRISLSVATREKQRAVDEQQALTDKNESLENEKQALADEIQALVNEKLALADESQALVDEKLARAGEQNAVADKGQAMADEQQALADQVAALTGEKLALADQVQALTSERDRLADQNQALVDEKQALADENRALTDEKQALADQTQTLADENQSLADEKQALSDESQTRGDKIRKVKDKSKELIETIRTLKAERQLTTAKINEMKNMLIAVHQRTLALQSEFNKAGEFYKAELAKSFKARKRLEEEVKTARAEQDAFNERMRETAKSQGHESAEALIMNAEAQLGQISTLERNLKKIRSDKADLLKEINRLRKVNETLSAENAEVVELRINNEQLVSALEALERSRAKHESDAKDAQLKAKESEQTSDTLRMRLSDLEQGFAEMEKEQNEAIQSVRDAAASAQPTANQDIEYPEIYDLIPSSGSK
jgi:chromosome segregation ATPase